MKEVCPKVSYVRLSEKVMKFIHNNFLHFQALVAFESLTLDSDSTTRFNEQVNSNGFYHGITVGIIQVVNIPTDAFFRRCGDTCDHCMEFWSYLWNSF
jgi:hypothetical protein